MNNPDTIRNEVSKAYAKALNAPANTSCCGGTPPKGVLAQVAGYETTELALVPEDATIQSFGCGNPVAFSEVKPGDTVLDLGSGAGLDLILAAQKVGPQGRVIGVDMTDEMIERARANIKSSGHTNIEVRKGFIEALPVEDASVDWIISNCVINLSPEKERVFAEMARVLKPGGRILVSDIMVKEISPTLKASKELYASCIAGAIPETEYLAGLRRAGLSDVKVKSRLTYEPDQICGLIDSEKDSDGCCGGALTGEMARQAASELAGKVWSANVSARKP